MPGELVPCPNFHYPPQDVRLSAAAMAEHKLNIAKFFNLKGYGQARAIESLRKTLKIFSLYFFETRPLFYQNEKYMVFNNKKLLYGDWNHLSIYGGNLVANELIAKMAIR